MKFKCLLFFLIFFRNEICHADDSDLKDTILIKEWLAQSTKLQRTHQDSSYNLAQQALIHSQALNYKKGIGSALVRIGSILYTNGKYDSALLILDQARIIRKSLNDLKGTSGVYVLLSYIYKDIGKQDSAFSCLYNALRLNEEAKDSITLVQTYITLGNLNLAYGDSKKAIECYLESEKISKNMGYEEGILFSFDGLGSYYLYVKEYDKALYYFREIDSLTRNNGDIVSNAQNAINLGICYENLSNYESAKMYYNQAITDYLKQKLHDGLAGGYLKMGSLYLKLHKPDSAIYYLNMALPIARDVGVLKILADCYKSLSNAYSSKGDYLKAYQYYVHFYELSDSLLNDEKVKQIAEMQTKYETKKKETEILLLNEQNKTKSNQRNFFIAGTILFLLLAGSILVGLIKTRGEKKKTESLLLNILPFEVANELKTSGTSEARQYSNVTVLFTDFVNFTGISEQMNPKELVKEINKNFTAFDLIMEKYGVEKIKTIGDAYLSVCGLPIENPNHAERILDASLALQSYIAENKSKFQIRIGVHSGPVVAGIVGVKKFAYDIWGDTVNTASRMESSGEPGKINISEATYLLIKDKFDCTYRGKIDVKNKGLIDMYFVNRKNDAPL